MWLETRVRDRYSENKKNKGCKNNKDKNILYFIKVETRDDFIHDVLQRSKHMMISLQKSKRVLYTKKLKKNLNMTAIYKKDLFFFKFCFGATFLHDYDLQKKFRFLQKTILFEYQWTCCKIHTRKKYTWMKQQE